MDDTMNILQQIVDHKREEVAARRQRIKLSSLSDAEHFNRTPISLRRSLDQHPIFGIIAEIKRASPSADNLRRIVSPENIARQYQRHGAAGISVLTDERFFSGSLADLESVRPSVSLPLLRKDFILHEYQIFEAKAFGADAVLLIAGILDQLQLRDLHAAADGLGLECLVELYESSEIDILDFDRMKLVGINNRNLRTFQVELQRSIDIARSVPEGITIVGESGIHCSDDLRRLSAAGIRAALIGEHLMKSEKPGEALKSLLDAFAARPRDDRAHSV